MFIVSVWVIPLFCARIITVASDSEIIVTTLPSSTPASGNDDDVVLLQTRLELAQLSNTLQGGCSARLGYKYCSGLEYGGNSDQRLDLYLPNVASTKYVAAVVSVPGNGWKGYRSSRLTEKVWPCGYLVDAGIACTFVSYRADPWPAQHQDMLSMIRWLRGKGPEYGIGTKIGVLGWSSGAGMSAFAWALNGRSESDVDPSFTPEGPYQSFSTAVDAAVLYATSNYQAPLDTPPCRLDSNAFTHEDCLGCPTYTHNNKTLAAIMNPISYITESASPVFMIHGVMDPIVGVCNTVHMQDAAESVNVDVKASYLPDRGHVAGIHGHLYFTDGLRPDMLIMAHPDPWASAMVSHFKRVLL